jgi:multidrug/hemolysin transport system permease protein
MTMLILIKRNTKLFFKDKGMFLTSLITPAILLVLYATFLSEVYKDSFMMALPEGLSFAEGLIDGCVAAQLMSSILAVSCVTVAFCSNMLMVQDRANGSIKDITVSPVKSSTLALSYYFATLISTLVICFTATAVCLLYVWYVGWYLAVSDVLFLILDVFLLVMFGTALSSVIGFFLSSQGQISAVGTIISSCYGFICGAYMPI